ncbi:MAG: 30S ribosomal protein S12 methylthiotransferase RimO [Peptococcaceae bacterium]
MAKVAFISLGCPKNLIDSENMIALVAEAKLDITNNPKDAEVIVVNTCGFISSAKEESINTILEMAEYKKDNCKVLVAVGCLVQKYHKELQKELPEIDAFLGTDNYHEIVDIITKALEKQKIIKVNKEHTVNYPELPRILTTPRHYAYLRIAEGCDNCCTFCAIPQIRGPYRSRPQEDILKEAKKLVNNGVRELILVAQDTTQYGIDLYGEIKLVELLKRLAGIGELRWIRLLYCYPNDFPEELIQLMKIEPKICKYLDLPLQHADNTILKKMGRHITQEEIRELIVKLRSNIPDITIRSTFIVGFPGESQENFRNLLNFLQDAGLERVGAFPYSREDDTPAGKMASQINQQTKQSRLNRLMKLQKEILLKKHGQYIGSDIIVQVDGPSQDIKNLWICRSQGEAPDIDPVILVFSLEQLSPGQLLSVKITHLQDFDLIGEINRELT